MVVKYQRPHHTYFQERYIKLYNIILYIIIYIYIYIYIYAVYNFSGLFQS